MFEDASLTGKQWLLPAGGTQDIAGIVAQLLRTRKLDTPIAPPVFPNMEQVVERITAAVQRKEQIAIFGDYDCDGITATAQLVRFFRRKGMDPLVRLPHRIRDGYGLRPAIIEEFHLAGIELLITVDNGISATEEIALAKEYGIDTLITDHHAVGEDIPPATLVLHPELAGCPGPHPSGAGVVFLLLEALEKGTWEERPIDMVLAMCGTVADLVELRGYNRQLVREGTQALQQIKSGPLALLRDTTGARTSTDIAFRVAPRINAAGRMADPLLALEALLSGGNPLDELDELNIQRQQQMHELYDEVQSSIDKTSALLFAADKSYPHGLIGLIAGRLTEATGHPSCVVTIEGEECTASLRSPACYHITKGLARCTDLLTRFGGHAQAAGCNFPLRNVEALQKKLSEDIALHTDKQDLQPSIQIDAFLVPENITLAFCKALETLEPFGAGNPEPRFLLEGVELEGVKAVGKDGTHLQCSAVGCKAIGFGLASLKDDLHVPLDVLCRLQIDEWNGHAQPQLIIDDVRVAKRAPVRY
jgi:single-stranded-DNA-specific exonuclease